MTIRRDAEIAPAPQGSRLASRCRVVIPLDTDVISALMQSSSDSAVVRRLDRQPPDSVWTTAISVFEVRFGLELLTTAAGGGLSGRKGETRS